LAAVTGPTGINIHLGPGDTFRIVGQLLPGEHLPALLQTSNGYIYLGTGWIDNQFVVLDPPEVCAPLPVISKRDSSPGSVCTIRAARSPSDLRSEPDPTADRIDLLDRGATLTAYRAVTGTDGQVWYYAVTNNVDWHFGWMPAAHAEALSPCPPPEP
jgi:hypothetical protein